MDDEELVDLVHSGETEALDFLIHKYQRFVYAKAKSYFIVGADREDLIQEGMIGLYKAIRDYKKDKLKSFKSFAELCITRQIITAVKTATRQKHIPLNSYVSLYKPVFNGDTDKTLLDVVTSSNELDPEEVIISQEEHNDIEVKISELLTDLEREVLLLYLEGQTYKEISGEFNRSVKAIDNALTRVKRKLEKLDSKEAAMLSSLSIR